jgi:hypothetical protein
MSMLFSYQINNTFSSASSRAHCTINPAIRNLLEASDLPPQGATWCLSESCINPEFWHPRCLCCPAFSPQVREAMPMDLVIWLPAMVLLGVAALILMVLFVLACDRI